MKCKLIVMLALLSVSLSARIDAQTCAPTCRDINIPLQSGLQLGKIDLTSYVKIYWESALVNFDCADPLSFDLTSRSGVVLFSGQSDEVKNEDYILFSSVCPYLDKGLVLHVQNQLGACESRITIKSGIPENLPGRVENVYCNDPLIALSEDDKITYAPDIYLACPPQVEKAGYVSDWITSYECGEAGDTARVILREWEFFDKENRRGVSIDTIVVRNFPALDQDHLFAPVEDTILCGDTSKVGPYLLWEETPGSGSCDTLYFLQAVADGTEVSFTSLLTRQMCGLHFQFDTVRFGSGCNIQYRVDVQLKQDCAGSENEANCTVSGENALMPVDADALYWAGSFWLYLSDTVPPLISCDLSHYDPSSILEPTITKEGHCFDTPRSETNRAPAPVILVSTGTHDCAAVIHVPPICVQDDCYGISMVKATIEGVGTIVMEPTGSGTHPGETCYGSTQPISLPMRPEPYQISYEVFDACHNRGQVYCYVLVKDLTLPQAVSDKSVTVDLSGKKAWIGVETFDEGSSDNCGLNVKLVRRKDWWQQLAIDSGHLTASCIDPAWNTIDFSLAEEGSLLAHYQEFLTWLHLDGQPCADLIWNAWQYDVLKRLNVSDSLPDLITLIKDLDTCATFHESSHMGGCVAISSSLTDPIAQIGGGWTDAIAVTCADVCSSVAVEMLVMDYWCNWSMTWSEVHVEDKTPVEIVKDLSPEVEITCRQLETEKHSLAGVPASLKAAVEAAALGDSSALEILNGVFGTYQKAWTTPEGTFVDIQGDYIMQSLYLIDSVCACNATSITTYEMDHHLGLVRHATRVDSCAYDADSSRIDQGILAVNCVDNVHCEQQVWYDWDECGAGIIYRKFRFWSGCSDTHAVPDTLERIQRIYVGNSCPLSTGMFHLPDDQVVYGCEITYDEGSKLVSGIADPTITGKPVYRFDDDCRIIGLGREDKVFQVVGGGSQLIDGEMVKGPCFKVVRKWYMADCCQSVGMPEGAWWNDPGDIQIDTFVQKIFVVDTAGPACTLTGPVNDGGFIAAGGCFYDLQVSLTVSDACAPDLEYVYDLLVEEEDGLAVTVSGSGMTEGGMAMISVPALEGGDYQLRVQVEDACQNESICTYDFILDTGKKPSPSCITDLTVELTPMDLDGDGTLDTAMATIWAIEFNASSTAPCGYSDDLLTYYIEFLDASDPDFVPLDTSETRPQLTFGCDRLGLNVVRFWVLSPTGSSDFCDVILRVQNNYGEEVCPLNPSDLSTISGQIFTEDDLRVEDVSVLAESTSLPPQTQSTDESGMYQFTLEREGSVTITPSKDGDDMNGVSTADLLPLFFHANGSSLLASPHLQLAADMNRDGFINGADVIVHRDLLLANITELDVDSWRFVRSDYEFSSGHPEAENVPESFTGALSETHTEVDFIAIKMGDMNLDRKVTTTRSGSPLVVRLEDLAVSQGQMVDVRLPMSQLPALMGMQFSLRTDSTKAMLTEVRASGTFGNENLGLTEIESGVVHVSWINADGHPSWTENDFITLTLSARTHFKLSDVLSMGGGRLQAEGYISEEIISPLALIYDHQDESAIRIRPNPFIEELYLEIDASPLDAGKASLVVFDTFGSLVYRQSVDMIAGANRIFIDGREMGPAGVYQIVLTTNNGVYTEQVIHLE